MFPTIPPQRNSLRNEVYISKDSLLQCLRRVLCQTILSLAGKKKAEKSKLKISACLDYKQRYNSNKLINCMYCYQVADKNKAIFFKKNQTVPVLELVLRTNSDFFLCCNPKNNCRVLKIAAQIVKWRMLSGSRSGIAECRSSLELSMNRSPALCVSASKVYPQ